MCTSTALATSAQVGSAGDSTWAKDCDGSGAACCSRRGACSFPTRSHWVASALPAARRIVKREASTSLVTTSPRFDALIGARCAAAYLRWIADLRDSVVAKSDRHYERALVRLKEKANRSSLAPSPVGRCDRLRTQRSPRRMTALGTRGRNSGDTERAISTTPPIETSRRALPITHTATSFGKRDPPPVLSALAQIDARSRLAHGDSAPPTGSGPRTRPARSSS